MALANELLVRARSLRRRIIRHIAFRFAAAAPLAVLATLLALQVALDLEVSYAPVWRNTVNTLFLPVGALPLATLAAIGVLRTGRLQLAWFGAGVIALGLAIVLANWVDNPAAMDAAVKIQNIGALLAGSAHFAGALGTLSSPKPMAAGRQRRLLTLLAIYGGAIAAALLVAWLATKMFLPVFFVQGQGGTNLRQVVLTVATMLFAGSALLSLLAHYRGSRSSFLYAYGLGLALLALGQLAYMYSGSAADAMSWLGRTAQWLGAVYFFVACAILIRGSRSRLAGFDELLESLFPSFADGYRLLIQSSADSIIGVDADGRVLIWSRAAESMFGYGSGEAVGRPIVELTGIKIPDRAGSRIVEGELLLSGREGHEFWARVTVANGGDIASHVAAVVVGDITEHKRAEADRERLLEEAQAQNEVLRAQAREIQNKTEEIQTRNEELQIANHELARTTRIAEDAVRARDEFLSVAAHELKTPVTSLRGFAQTLLRQYQKHGALDVERLSRALQIIDQQSDKLTKLVFQLLDLARLEGGQLVLERRRVDLVDLVDQMVDAARMNATKHTIVVKAPATAEALVDPLRIEHVVTNLVDNAIRYSPNGGPVEISVCATDSVVEIAVRDRGIGIPPEDRPHVFDRFYRAHESRSIAGLGLGLFISKEIVMLHGGSIAVDCPPDGGTCFVIRLPAGQ